MNKQQKRKWVKALLSGEYEQGALSLKANGRYCCLGVYGEAVLNLSDEFLVSAPYIDDGLSPLKGAPSYAVQRELACLNDEGVPFDMIAGLIDEAL